MKNLEKIGFDSWFQSRVDEQKTAVHELARVVSVHRDSYVITKGATEVYADNANHVTIRFVISDANEHPLKSEL